eukprot:TRINITY_DN21592_c0_g1_i1.p3 TRINITY_DN21592_c0_g1~~TRINITY_DN21592_c0_g1_i1.p3  ORF type:complete len:212 (-),score=-18.70 TRINITY_DN21592_c0_g1_i1:1038-1673(-)
MQQLTSVYNPANIRQYNQPNKIMYFKNSYKQSDQGLKLLVPNQFRNHFLFIKSQLISQPFSIHKKIIDSSQNFSTLKTVQTILPYKYNRNSMQYERDYNQTTTTSYKHQYFAIQNLNIVLYLVLCYVTREQFFIIILDTTTICNEKKNPNSHQQNTTDNKVISQQWVQREQTNCNLVYYLIFCIEQIVSYNQNNQSKIAIQIFLRLFAMSI